jgi:hypothetical protein
MQLLMQYLVIGLGGALGDSEAGINAFLPILDGMISGGLVTLEKMKVLHYRGAEDPD